jgi:hypothetical protein
VIYKADHASATGVTVSRDLDEVGIVFQFSAVFDGAVEGAEGNVLDNVKAKRLFGCDGLHGPYNSARTS